MLDFLKNLGKDKEDKKENEEDLSLKLTRTKSNDERRPRRRSLPSFLGRDSDSSPVRRAPSRQKVSTGEEEPVGGRHELVYDDEEDTDSENETPTEPTPLDQRPEDSPEEQQRKRELMTDSFVSPEAAKAEADSAAEADQELDRNTRANAAYEPMEVVLPIMTVPGEGPNFVMNSRTYSSYEGKRNVAKMELHKSPVEYRKNRAVLTITHGNPAKVNSDTSRTPRRFVVGVDLNQESFYALQWAIGTVLRDGDELYVRTIMETDTKFDVEGGKDSNAKTHRKIREGQVLLITRKVTSLVEKTNIQCKIECAAIHAKDARYALLDEIRVVNPLIVIVGTRGLHRMRRILLGGVSNSIVQNSSAPVMVVRRPMRTARTIRRPMALSHSDLQDTEPRVGFDAGDANEEREPSKEGAAKQEPPAKTQGGSTSTSTTTTPRDIDKIAERLDKESIHP